MNMRNEQQPSIRPIFTADDQSTFLEGYFACTGRPPERQKFLRGIAADLFRRSYTGAYFQDGAMVGGFCLTLKPPFCEFELLPADIRNSHPFIQAVDTQEMISLPMLWLNKDFRGPRHSVTLWSGMLSSIYRSNRGYLLYTYQLQEERNWKLYKRGGGSTNIYEGLLANGGIGGVDYVPVENLAPQIDYLKNFSERRQAA
jgi:hypothetical protein